MKWPVLVKSPGPMLQITGRPATRARRTDSSSAGSSSAESPSWAAPSVMKAQAVPSEEAHPIRSDNAPASAGERSLLPVSATYAMARHVGPQPVTPNAVS